MTYRWSYKITIDGRKMCKLLIIGKTPLPIGGVTIHVQRLIELLDFYNVDYTYYDLSKFKFYSFCLSVCRSEYAHLHSSSPILRLFFALLCKIVKTKSIITYHGNIGRFGCIKNSFDRLSIIFAKIPVVLNNKSFIQARRLNKNTQLCSAYIPECLKNNNTLNSFTNSMIVYFKQHYKFIFCTNAFNIAYDKFGKEIYGIDFLVHFFSGTDYALIISDPSGNYKKKIKEVRDNILFIDYPHSFIEVLQLSDCFIRYTSTDGDSLSIHEAIDNNVPVIATDVVSRPHGVVLVKLDDEGDLRIKLKQVIECHGKIEYVDSDTDIQKKKTDIVKLYESLQIM